MQKRLKSVGPGTQFKGFQRFCDRAKKQWAHTSPSTSPSRKKHNDSTFPGRFLVGWQERVRVRFLLHFCLNESSTSLNTDLISPIHTGPPAGQCRDYTAEALLQHLKEHDMDWNLPTLDRTHPENWESTGCCLEGELGRSIGVDQGSRVCPTSLGLKWAIAAERTEN